MEFRSSKHTKQGVPSPARSNAPRPGPWLGKGTSLRALCVCAGPTEAANALCPLKEKADPEATQGATTLHVDHLSQECSDKMPARCFMWAQGG